MRSFCVYILGRHRSVLECRGIFFFHTMLKIVRYSSTLAKLWVKHNGGQATQVPAAGCVNVSDLLKTIKKELSPELDRFSPAQLTLHKTLYDAALEPDLPLDSIADAGLSAKVPLLVKVPGKTSKVALVLQSNATLEEKVTMLEDLLESEMKAKDREVQAKDQAVQAKDQTVQAKDREVQAKDSLLQQLKEKLQGIESERDFLKGTLDARNILEKYEKRFEGKNLGREKNWKMHLDRNQALKSRLQECGKDIVWHKKVADIYKHLSKIVHTDTSRVGGGRFLVMIRKNLPEIDVCFIRAITEEIYGEHVRVNTETDEDN